MAAKKKYMVLVKLEPDNPDPREGQKGREERKTIAAYSLNGAIKQGEKFGEVLEAFAK